MCTPASVAGDRGRVRHVTVTDTVCIYPLRFSSFSRIHATQSQDVPQFSKTDCPMPYTFNMVPRCGGSPGHLLFTFPADFCYCWGFCCDRRTRASPRTVVAALNLLGGANYSSSLASNAIKNVDVLTTVDIGYNFKSQVLRLCDWLTPEATHVQSWPPKLCSNK